MTNPVDLRLYALVDPERSGGYALPDLAARVVKGGATLGAGVDHPQYLHAIPALAENFRSALLADLS